MALVCPTCASCLTLTDLGLRTYAQLSAESARRTDGAATSAPVDGPRAAGGGTDGKRMARILAFWRSVEMLTAQGVPKPDPREDRVDVAPGVLAPWELGHRFSLRPIDDTRKERRYTVYGGVYALDRVHRTLASVFPENSVDVDERTPRGESALFAAEVTSDGRFVLDSITLSTAAWAVGRAVRPGPGAPDWLDGFDEVAQVVRDELAAAVAADENDAHAGSMRERGVAVSRPLSSRLLHEMVVRVTSRFGIEDVLAPAGLRVACHVLLRGAGHETRPEFLNSFLSGDLERVAAAARRGEHGAALASYLSTEPTTHRVDVRAPENLDDVVALLAPDRIPAGRWPEPPDRLLATSQQLAINALAGDFSRSAGVFAVNGPPGTGKTTMLRDLVAAVVTERACHLADLERPSAGLVTDTTGWRTGRTTVRFRPLIPALTGFEMVVASSNNGAVENVTRELPVGTLPVPWAGTDHFGDIATRALGEPAWGLVAAVLGKKTNRQRFATTVWFSTPGTDGGAPEVGLNDWLKDRHADPDPLLWPTAVAAFRATLAAEHRIREQRKAAHDALGRVPALRVTHETAQSAVNRAAGEVESARSAADRADGAEREAADAADMARAAREAHRSHKPGALEILFTFGSAIRRWYTEDEPLAARHRGAEASEAETKVSARRHHDALTSAEARLASAGAALRQVGADLDAATTAVEGFRSSTDARIPDDAWRRSGDDRELAAPWLDTAWNTARTDVFLAALELHRAFLVAGGHAVRTALGAAVDVVKGSVPADASTEAVRAAWQWLFFLVPVVSTTFASVERMLGGLDSESLGWLLVDEAGQAAPQQAAGAIWRSRRVVAVGDPFQLQPVVTVLHSTEAHLRDHHGVDSTWSTGQQSVQTLADRAAPLGTSLPGPDGEPVWVGAPLRVHRRCDEPMFSVVNDAVYSGLMIRPEPDPPRTELDLLGSRWIDVRSSQSHGNWVPAEGDKAVEVVSYLLRLGIAEDEIFVISPFRAAASALARVVRRLGATGVTCGTVHVSQGKQADVVVLVLGGDPSRPGARAWAAQEPHLLNVAVSRAKRRLYVIGDREAWGQLPYFSTLAVRLPVHEGRA